MASENASLYSRKSSRASDTGSTSLSSAPVEPTTQERVGRLLTIKSLVTLTATLVFSLLTLFGTVSGQQFLTVYTVIIGFYFGTQYERNGGRG